ncbi:MAG: HlyD family efflux transporter periplasmic adaptor subunit [Symploca sp. SIO2B6]|nr:HlyD family efflux transporter periplasmic adaptor subunit [Symploca sp. SIO2B6]
MVSTPQPKFLPLAQENEFLPPISLWMKLSGVFIVGGVGIAIILASVAKYKTTVKAPAFVRPTGELRIVQAASSSSIVSISVKENQAVKKGEVIATLDDSRLQTRKSQLQSNVQQSELQLTQFNAQLQASKRQISAETQRIQTAITVAQAELEHHSRGHQDRQITTAAHVAEAEANLRLAHNQWQQAQAQLKSAQATLSSIEAALEAAKSRRNRYQPVAELGALSQDQLEEAQLTVNQQEQAVEAQKATIEAQKQTIEQQKQAVEAAEARLQHALAAINPSNAEVKMATERISQQKASGEATIAILNREKEALIQQRIEVQKQLERNKSELEQVEKDLSKTIITAPADGIILKLNLRNSGQTVQPGEKIAQIAPSNTPWVVKALVTAADIGKVKTDQKTQLRISACPYPDYGTLKGVVTSVSPDAITSQNNSNTEPLTAKNSSQANAFYEVTIEPESLSLSQGNHQCYIQLGMQGRVDIISREESVLRFFLRKARLITDL